MPPYIINVFIDLVREYEQVVVGENHLGQLPEFLFRIDAPRRIARRAENDQLRLRRDGRLELCGGDLEVLTDAGRHDDRRASRQLHHLRVTYPVGGGDDDLVAGVHQCQDGIAHPLLAARADDDLGSGVVQAVLPLQLPRDGLPQDGIAGDGGVLRVIVVNRLLAGFLDETGRHEVGFAHAHVDDVNPLRLHLAALLRHGQRSGRSQPFQTV